MGRWFWSHLFLALGLGFSAPIASAYVPTTNNEGRPIRWKGPVKINFVGNPGNISGLDPTSFFNAVVTGLQRWKAASAEKVTFDYWQGEDNAIYPANSNYNGYSSIYFASNAPAGDNHLSSNILGMTQVWYNTDSGEILETDIVLNDRNFHFTNNPQDTSGYGTTTSGSTDGKTNVYIQNVITHEIGHAFGLSHSGGLQSTMLFMESPEQAHLGCDELIAIHALYPSGDEPTRGSISGFVISDLGQPIFGAHVLAISSRRGTVLATALTNRSGKYLLEALEPGTYYIMVEPFYAGPQALPSFYSASTAMVCKDGTSFGRTFLTQAEGFYLTSVNVSPSINTSAPTLNAHCDGSGGASVGQNPLSNTPESASVIFQGGNGPVDFGITDRLKVSKPSYYRLNHLSGHLEIHAMSYSIYSPIHPSLSLYTSDLKKLKVEMLDPVYQGDSGYINHDSGIKIEDLPEGDYYLEVTAGRLQPNDYPAGPISLDQVPFLVVAGSTRQESPPLAGIIPENARCRMEEIFPSYSSPPGPPVRTTPDTGQSDSGFCSGIKYEDSAKTPRKGEILGWFLPWLFMIGAGRIAIRLRTGQRPDNLMS